MELHIACRVLKFKAYALAFRNQGVGIYEGQGVGI